MQAWLASLTLVMLMGCDAAGADRADVRFAKATVGHPCPLFMDDVLNGSGLPRCPFPEGQQGPLPCAIDHFIEGDPSPRARRLLQFDEAGRLVAFSDARGGEVVASRRLVFEGDDQQRVVHHYEDQCDAAVPSYLFSVREKRDAQGRLVRLSSGAYSASLAYDFTPGLIFDSATIKADNNGRRQVFELDTEGYVTRVSNERTAVSLDVDARNGRLLQVRWWDAEGSEQASARYEYAGPVLSRLHFDYPQHKSQTYVFHYACTEAPACVARDGVRRDVHLLQPTALSRDPGLVRFVPRNCSDQLDHGEQLCGAVLPDGPLSARCCRTSPKLIDLIVRTPIAGHTVDRLALEADGRRLLSGTCRGEDYALFCPVEREALTTLPDGPLRIELLNADGQPLDILQARVKPFKAAAR